MTASASQHRLLSCKLLVAIMGESLCTSLPSNLVIGVVLRPFFCLVSSATTFRKISMTCLSVYCLQMSNLPCLNWHTVPTKALLLRAILGPVLQCLCLCSSDWRVATACEGNTSTAAFIVLGTSSPYLWHLWKICVGTDLVGTSQLPCFHLHFLDGFANSVPGLADKGKLVAPHRECWRAACGGV